MEGLPSPRMGLFKYTHWKNQPEQVVWTRARCLVNIYIINRENSLSELNIPSGGWDDITEGRFIVDTQGYEA